MQLQNIAHARPLFLSGSACLRLHWCANFTAYLQLPLVVWNGIGLSPAGLLLPALSVSLRVLHTKKTDIKSLINLMSYRKLFPIAGSNFTDFNQIHKSNLDS